MKTNASLYCIKNYVKKNTIFVVISAILLLFFIFLFLSFLSIKAQSKPDHIVASSIGSNTFTVTHFTDWKTESRLVVADNKEFKEAIFFADERDYNLDGDKYTSEKRNSHVLTARGLNPDTKYWYKVETLFNSEFDKEVFTIKTPKVSDEVPVPIPIFGYVVDRDNKPLKNIIIEVYSSRADDTRSSTISTYTAENGSYSLDLANLRSFDLSEYWEMQKDGIPSKVIVTAKSNSEEYYYEVKNGQYTPVETFAFRSTDQSYSNRIIGQAKAEGKCTFNTGDDCSSNCNGRKGTYYCLEPETGLDTCTCEGDEEEGDTTSTEERDEAKCNEAQRAKQNCDYFKKTESEKTGTEILVCGWEDAYQQLQREGNCGDLSDTPSEVTPTRDIEKQICDTLHQSYAEVFGNGGQFEGDACKAGNYARSQALSVAGGDHSNIDCGSGKPISVQDECGSPPSQPPTQNTPLSESNDPNCLQAGGGNNEFFKCNKSKGEGFAIAYTDSSCNAVANAEYCNGACVDSGEVNECLGESKPAESAPDQTPQQDGPEPIKLPSKVEGQNKQQPNQPSPIETTPISIPPLQNYSSASTPSDTDIQAKNTACKDAGLGKAVFFYNDSTNKELLCEKEIRMYKCKDESVAITKIDMITSDSIPAYECMFASHCAYYIDTNTCSLDNTNIARKSSNYVLCQRDNINYTCRNTRTCGINSSFSFGYQHPDWLVHCEGIYKSWCLDDGRSVIKNETQPGSKHNAYQCVQKGTLPTCDNSSTLTCYDTLSNVPPETQTSSCYKEDDYVYQCECTNIDGVCTNNVNVPIKKRPSTVMRPDDNLSCSGGLVNFNGKQHACFISHCIYDTVKNAKNMTPTFTTTSIDVIPHSCIEGESYELDVGSFVSLDDSYADPIMCAEIPNGYFDHCASSLNFPKESINIGDTLEFIHQTKARSAFKIIGRDNDTLYRLEHQTPGFIAESSDGLICHGDSGGIMYNASNNAVGVVSYWVTENGEKDPSYRDNISNVTSCSNKINIVPFNTASTTSNNITDVNSKVLGVNDSKKDSSTLEDSRITLDPGQYELSNGMKLNLTSPTKLSQFSDINGNGKRDPGEPNVIDRTLSISKIGDSFNYEMNRGWNTANFPFFRDKKNMYKASDIKAYAMSQGVDIESIKKWEGKWVEYTVNNGTVYGNDFNIKPNEGYFIRVLTSGKFDLFGSTSMEPVPVQLESGWSLVGFAPGMNQEGSKIKIQYSNKSFEDGIKSFELLEVINSSGIGVKSDNVTKWDNGVYRGVNLKNGKEFGLDFNINRTDAYFVRSDKKSVFIP